MKKLLCLLAFLISVFLLGFPSRAANLDEFTLRQQLSYQIDSRGGAQVVEKTVLANNFANIYPQEFIASLPGQASNISAYDQKGNIIEEKKHLKDSWQLKLKFNQPGVGKGKETRFTVTYYWPHFAEHRGQVWYLVLPSPKDIQKFQEYRATVWVPLSFHNLAHSSVTPSENIVFGQKRRLVFEKSQFQEGVIALSFADFQAFDFTFHYQISNQSKQWEEQLIPLPPITNYQNILFRLFDPLPQQISINKDSNWLAHYLLAPGETKNVTVSGQALLFASPERRAFYNQLTKPEIFLKATPLWPATDPRIKQKAQQLKTPANIYNFVVHHLNYHLASPSAIRRRGGLDAFLHPQNAVCTEFTDLFISLARAAGIPAREIEGYAYTNNPKLRPGGEQALHAWPEYWDKTKKLWVEVDPTWGNTTGGIDYFSRFDLNHFALVIHGSDDRQPAPPGSYALGKSWDIHFARQLYVPNNQPSLSLTLQNVKKIASWSHPRLQLIFSVQNKSFINIDGVPYQLLLDRHQIQQGQIDYLPLFGEMTLQVNFSPFIFPFPKTFIFKTTINGQPVLAQAPLGQHFYLLIINAFRFYLLVFALSLIIFLIFFHQTRKLF